MRRVWIGLLAALLVLGAADTLAWYWATARLKADFAAWVQARRDAGWTVQAGPPHRTGWPLSATLVVPRVRLGLPSPSMASPSMANPGLANRRPLTWQAERLVLRLRPRFPPRLSLSAAGAQNLGIAGGPAIPYTASRLVLHLPPRYGREARTADLAVRGLRIGTGDQASVTLGTLRLKLEWLDPDTAGSPGLRLTLVAHDIVLPPGGPPLGSPLAPLSGRPPGHPSGRPWPLGRRIASVAVHGALRGVLPVAGSPLQWAEAFQRAGDRLVLREAALRWGPLTASLAATLRLDPALQPEGQGRAMVSGYAQALDTLAANGAVENDTALAAKAALSLLADAPHESGAATITIPVVLHSGTLSADGLPLLRLPPLQLPPAAAPR